MKSNRFTCSWSFLSFWNKHVVVPATHCAEWEATAARDLSNCEHLRYLPLILPAINVPLASDYINGISSFSSMIVMSFWPVSLFFWYFAEEFLKTWLKKGEGGGNFSQSRERHSTRILLGSGDWCYARLLGRICHKSW